MRTIVLLLCAADCGDSLAEDAALIDVADLRIRDPFVFADIPNARYVMVASLGNRQRGAKGWEFCHEWVQIGDGTLAAVRLAADLSKPVGEPILLFRASDATWCRPVQPGKYVTDGPCFYRLKSGPLLMLWSSFGERGYAVGVARSANGTMQGPWSQDRLPIYEGGGHCMISWDPRLGLRDGISAVLRVTASVWTRRGCS